MIWIITIIITIRIRLSAELGHINLGLDFISCKAAHPLVQISTVITTVDKTKNVRVATLNTHMLRSVDSYDVIISFHPVRRQSSLIRSDPFSPIMMVGTFV